MKSKLFYLVVILAVVFTQSLNAQSDLNAAQLDSFIYSKMEQQHWPGLSMCIVRDGEIIQNGSFGFANIEQNIEVSDSTIFLIASISKTVTATALMQLYEDDEFGLDDNINNYLRPELQIINPYFPDDSITFRQLLTHTSSIDYDYGLDFGGDLYTWGFDPPLPLDSLLINYFMPGGDYYSRGPFNNYRPGAAFEYSNMGITLVGYLVEEISGTPFEDYCQQNIFTPLGMTETSWFLAELDSNLLAMPYDYVDGDYVPIGQYSPAIWPAGNIRTSAAQYSRFLMAFMNMGELDGVRILDSATVELMTTP